MSTRLLGALAGCLLMVGALSACSEAENLADEAQREVESLSNSAIAETVAQRVETELAEEGIDLDQAPECDPSFDSSILDAGVQGAVTCTATTVEAQPVEAVLEGSFGPDGCSGALVVTVAGEERVNRPDVGVC